jgi:hypothetical protein
VGGCPPAHCLTAQRVYSARVGVKAGDTPLPEVVDQVPLHRPVALVTLASGPLGALVLVRRRADQARIWPSSRLLVSQRGDLVLSEAPQAPARPGST